MVDKPEILFSANSEYRDAKPKDTAAIANFMRAARKGARPK